MSTKLPKNKSYVRFLERLDARLLMENKILEHQLQLAEDKIKILESAIRCTLGAKREFKMQFTASCKRGDNNGEKR
jgi:hypothetical protein